jgi:hypothetical protein
MTLVWLCQSMRDTNAGYQCAEVVQAFSNKTKTTDRGRKAPC